MLGFQNDQTVQPLYDYYIETDLDSLDDQPVDYSKKYADQDTYEVRRQSKSSKASFPSSSEIPQVGKPSCSDEVKVYYMEGTPLTISSASSLCDLRDIGSNNLQISKNVSKKSEETSNYTSLNDDDLHESFAVKKDGNLLTGQINCTSDGKPKDDLSCKEGKSVSFRNEEDLSKASSPLMFSRSSSVCSLNSFEQHSLVDDRSSVSAFSTVASGIISPSELPDSPGEAVSLSSKEIPVRAISPIVKSDTDVLKDGSDNESNDILEDCIKHSLSDDELLDIKDSDETKNCNHATDISQLNTSEPCKSDDDFEADESDDLIEQCMQLGMPRALEHGPKEQNLKDKKTKCDIDSKSEEISVLLCQCTQEGKTNLSVKTKDESNFPIIEFQTSMSAGKNKNSDVEQDLLDESDDDEDDILVNQCIQLGMPTKISNAVEKPYNTDSNNKISIRDSSPDGVSDDDDDDDLIASCIRAGMPSPKAPSAFQEQNTILPNHNILEKVQKSNQLFDSELRADCVKNYCSEDVPRNHIYAPVRKSGPWLSRSLASTDSAQLPSAAEKRSFDSALSFNSSKKTFRDNCPDGISDDDEDDDLIASCIRAGMPSPRTLNNLQKRQATSSVSNFREKSPSARQSFTSEQRNDGIKKYCSAKLPQNSICATVHNSATWVSNSSFIDVDSMRIYRTEDTPILSPTASISDLSSLSFNDDKSCHDSYLNNSRNSNCSSESEDDELLLQCIRSGMPGDRRAVA